MHRTPTSSNAAKRRVTELSPDLSLQDVMTAIRGIETNLNKQLERLASKQDIQDLKESMGLEIEKLKAENESLKLEVQKLKKGRELEPKEILRLVDQSKRNRLFFKGVTKDEKPTLAVQKLCEDKLSLHHIKIREARSLYDKDNKCNIIAEFETVEMAGDILKNARMLRGSDIYIEKDLSSERQQNRKVLLQLKQKLLTLSRTHKIFVRNDSMNIDGKWMSYNNNKLLMCEGQPAEKILIQYFGINVSKIDITYHSLLEKINSKN